jgi:AcrR family transcriptional regulator
MRQRTVHWSALGRSPAQIPEGEGLRERKKQLMGQQLSDTATEMFLERGFDAVRVAEVAQACGVSEKTVFNYFPTKESLVLDRWDTTRESLHAGLADAEVSPVETAQRILAEELDAVLSWLADQDDPLEACALFRRFGELLHSTAALRAHQHEVTDQLVQVAAESLATRWRVGPGDPEPQMAATAVLGLWRIQSMSLGRHLDGRRALTRVRRAVLVDVARAAKVIDQGLRSRDTTAD